MTVPMPTYPDLAGKVAVVTGGSRGIGAATCRTLAASGTKVAVGGRDKAAIDAVVGEIHGAGGRAMAAPADCTDLDAIERMRRQVEEEYGPVDVLAAFAGGGSRPKPTAEITEDEWRAEIDGNLTATFLTIKSFLPGMTERGGGAIVTMASTAARLPMGAPTAYAAAKAGVVMLSRRVAAEVAEHDIRVNCIAPGATRTERTGRVMPREIQKRVAALHPLGRLGEPEDVAQATAYLVSAASSWVTGVTLDVAGGRIMI
ncbi:MAG: SDR family NAD(P)-dependent oxidoreductase [Streptosporangiaceae bacterium]